MQPKFPSDSITTLTDIVLPGETNPLNNLFGGELLARMDRAASITARRHSRRICVTASVNHVAFNKAIPLAPPTIRNWRGQGFSAGSSTTNNLNLPFVLTEVSTAATRPPNVP